MVAVPEAMFHMGAITPDCVKEYVFATPATTVLGPVIVEGGEAEKAFTHVNTKKVNSNFMFMLFIDLLLFSF
jgi:hypothetical protein